MSIFDNSLEPLKRMRRKARERRLLATQNVKDSLARRLEGDQEAFDHSPVSLVLTRRSILWVFCWCTVLRVHRIACARWLSILWSSGMRWRCRC